MSATGHNLRRRLQAQRAAQAAHKQPAPMPAPEPPKAPEQAAVFDLGGPWMKTRAQVRDTLGMDRVPKNKAEARARLEAAGYEVTEG